MSGPWFFLAGAFAGLGFLGGNWRLAFVPAAACLVLAWTGGRAALGRKKNGGSPTRKTSVVPQQAFPEPSTEERRQDTTRAFLKGDMALVGSEAQAREARKLALRELEDNIDGAIFDGLALLKQAVPGGHTYAVLFPGKNDGLYLRAWITDSGSVIAGAVLNSNQGLVGQLNKDGVRRVLEGDIVADSAQLHYYSGHDGVRSLAGVPILVKGVRRGAVIVDSLRENAFDARTIERLDSLANLLGHLAYHAYMAFEHAYHKEQLAALTSYQRKFLENMSVENIVTHVQNYMAECLEGDRFLVVERVSRQGDDARIVSCIGADDKEMQGLGFRLSEKGLAALAFEKEQIINRAFPPTPHVPRFSPREKAHGRMASLLAVPVPTDQGVDMVLMVESVRPRRFSEHHQNLLSTIARAAGFALSRARLYQEKEQLASRDGLTGVENHRTFQERFLNEILRAQRYAHQLAVMMMDIDLFKKVNDTYGHPVGDQVLKEVARIISQNIRAGTDLLARYGGEEFVVMLADTDRTRAGETAERIRESIAAKVFESGTVRFQVTMSIGGAIYPSDSRHGREILEKADKALYRAKETGRNRLVFYN
ncbi:MAG TPA: diguanylate cyclase [Fibrobacteria bacterium]|nr:diguanylate cyclase [Fibrobacteria bacterium]